MLFNSWIFMGLLLLTFLSYYILPKLRQGSNAQVGMLLVASLVFYAYETPVLVFLLLTSITVNFFASKGIVLASSGQIGKRWAFSVILFNLLVLAFFKYGKLICSTLLPTGAFTDQLIEGIQNIPLPIGISFYTFQAISLVVDLRRQGKVVGGMEKLENDFHSGKNWTSFLNVSFYIAFFPQLIAGPIVKAHDFIKQISVKHIGNIKWDIVIRNLILGYFLKMYVADNLKEVIVLINSIDLMGMSKINLLVLFYGYSLQIFADFAGYSLIAIGLGALFGYTLPVNFNFPYLSKSITEFWRRWHISLSSWLREYLYFPLGGNRKGAVRTYINLMVVMLLGGLWHGAAWSYMVWGGAHGLLLALERYSSNYTSKISFWDSKWMGVVKMTVIFHLVSILWLLFVMPDFSKAIDFFEAFQMGAWLLGSPQHLFVVLFYGSPVILYHFYALLKEANHERLVNGNMIHSIIEPIALSVMLFLIIVNSGTTGAFIYFQF
ncbi:MAG: MBOAT family O-acyltransferase [Rubritalea sp.]